MTPFFSIIIPVYNREKYIRKAIESMLAQTFQDWELIIIDDGSIDNTKNSVAEFIDNRIRYFYQENQERSIARNNGIEKSVGNYICFLDSDDYYLENHLQVLNDSILSNGSPIAFFYTGPFEKTGDKFKKRTIYTNVNEHPVRFVFFNFLLMNSVCIHKDILKKCKFIEHQTILEDINLWIRILVEYSFVQIPEYTTVCVIHEEQSAKRFFKDVELKIIQNYMDNFDHIFENSEADKYITVKERTAFKKKRYISAAFAAAWARKYGSLFKLIAKIVSISSHFLFEKTFYLILKEALSTSLKKKH